MGAALAVLVVVLSSCGTGAGGSRAGGPPPSSGPATTASPASSGPCVHAAIPAYFDPQSSLYWRVLTSGTGPAPYWVIINPNNGPGSAAQADYQNAVTAARQAGEHVLGYVLTGYGRRSPADVAADVARYHSWYGVNSIFFDEAPVKAAYLGAYQGYVASVHAHGGRAVLNPGTVPDRGYFSFADAVVTFESPASAYVKDPHRPGALVGIPSSRIWNIVVNTPPALLARVIGVAQSRHAGFLYATDGIEPDPYNTLPSYWAQELASASATCAGP